MLRQRYPSHKVEILVVDDRSEDATAELVQDFADRNGRVRLLRVRERTPHLAPKKRALELGIRHATGELIFVTDADCTPGPDWLTEMVRHFEPTVGLVSGFAPYRGDGTLASEVLQLDYFAMACVAAAGTGLGYPVSCSGANLAYRRALFDELGGFGVSGAWVSGDDDLFLERVRTETRWQIRYATHPATFVPTAPPASFREFVHQRLRYASKGWHYRWPVRLALLGVFLLNLQIVVTPVAALFEPALWPLWGAGWLLKFFSEGAFLRLGQRVFRLRFSWRSFAVASLLHPFYLVAAAVLAQFRTFEWKGERFSGRLPSVEASQSPASR